MREFVRRGGVHRGRINNFTTADSLDEMQVKNKGKTKPVLHRANPADDPSGIPNDCNHDTDPALSVAASTIDSRFAFSSENMSREEGIGTGGIAGVLDEEWSSGCRRGSGTTRRCHGVRGS